MGGSKLCSTPIDFSITARRVESGSPRRSLPLMKKAIKDGIHGFALFLLEKLES